MADSEVSSYPRIPIRQWWALRKRFKKTIPTLVTPGYLATALGMKEESANRNIIPSLVIFNIIDKEGNPLERAVQWRDDEQYAKVCEEIKKEIYPQELLDALPGPSPDRQAAENWFATRTGVGQNAARKMASVYVLLTEADLSKEPDLSSIATKPTRKKSVSKKIKSKQQTDEGTEEKPEERGKTQTEDNLQFTPSLHIDVQLHISPEASAEQIDQIFASMAKHLYQLKTNDKK